MVIHISLYNIAFKNNIQLPRPYQIGIREYKELFPKPKFCNELKKYLKCQRILISSISQRNADNKRNQFLTIVYNLLYNTYWLICQFVKDAYIIWQNAYIPTDLSFDSDKEEYTNFVMNIYRVFYPNEIHESFVPQIDCMKLKIM